MAERYLRISALFERTDLVKIDGHWCCPISGLSESLSRHGFRVVPTQPVPEGHGTQGEPAAALRSAHETALGDSFSEQEEVYGSRKTAAGHWDPWI